MTMRVVICDDIVGQVEHTASPHNPDNFRKAHQSENVEIHFASAWDDFLERYSEEEAAYTVEELGFTPDLILVDLLFGDPGKNETSMFLGLDIVERLSDKYPDVPRVLFTTISQSDRAHGHYGLTVGEVLDDLDAGYLNKDRVLESGFAAAIESYIASLS